MDHRCQNSWPWIHGIDALLLFASLQPCRWPEVVPQGFVIFTMPIASLLKVFQMNVIPIPVSNVSDGVIVLIFLHWTLFSQSHLLLQNVNFVIKRVPISTHLRAGMVVDLFICFFVIEGLADDISMRRWERKRYLVPHGTARSSLLIILPVRLNDRNGLPLFCPTERTGTLFGEFHWQRLAGDPVVPVVPVNSVRARQDASTQVRSTGRESISD